VNKSSFVEFWFRGIKIEENSCLTPRLSLVLLWRIVHECSWVFMSSCPNKRSELFIVFSVTILLWISWLCIVLLLVSRIGTFWVINTNYCCYHGISCFIPPGILLLVQCAGQNHYLKGLQFNTRGLFILVHTLFIIWLHCIRWVAFGGVVVSVLPTGPKVRGFKPGRGLWILRVIKSVAHLPSDGN
jgi:hypothetical protein